MGFCSASPEVIMETLKTARLSRIRQPHGGLILHNFVKSFADLLYPKICQACKKDLPAASVGGVVCLDCWSQIKMNRPPLCHACGRQMSRKDTAKNVCSHCARKNYFFDRAFSACVYDGTIKTLIHEFKYKDKEFLGRPLSTLLADFIGGFNLPVEYIDCLVPMPLHRAKLREREYNQAQILADHLAQAIKKPVLENNLFRFRATAAQASLEPHQRFPNVKGSFAVTEKNSISGRNIMLIDDVLTTGATASEAARALKEAGAGIVFVLTLAS